MHFSYVYMNIFMKRIMVLIYYYDVYIIYIDILRLCLVFLWCGDLLIEQENVCVVIFVVEGTLLFQYYWLNTTFVNKH